MKKGILCFIVAFAVSGCATSPDKIAASSVSPLIYQNYNCQQLVMEGDRVSRKTQALYASLDSKASTDSVQMTVGLLLLWPTLFFLEGGDGPEAAEYARLKGEYDAIHQAAIMKNCQMSLPPITPPVVATKPEEKNGEEECAEFTTC